MKARYRRIAILAGLIAAAIWWHSRTPEPTVLAFRLGQTFEQVVNDSTYPALKRSNKPRDDWDGNKFGAIWVTEPSVIIRFTDPKHRVHTPAHQIRRPQFLGKPGAHPCHFANARPAALRGRCRHPGKPAEPVQGGWLAALGKG